MAESTRMDINASGQISRLRSVYQIHQMMEGLNDKLVEVGETLISASFSNIANLAALLVYVILVHYGVFHAKR